jgi:hypothetical protein
MNANRRYLFGILADALVKNTLQSAISNDGGGEMFVVAHRRHRNDNEDDNTRIGPLPLEEEHAATRTESGPWLGTGHSSRSRTPIGTSDGRFRGGGAGAEDNGRPVATGNGCTVNDKGNLVPWVDLRHCKQ